MNAAGPPGCCPGAYPGGRICVAERVGGGVTGDTSPSLSPKSGGGAGSGSASSWCAADSEILGQRTSRARWASRWRCATMQGQRVGGIVCQSKSGYGILLGSWEPGTLRSRASTDVPLRVYVNAVGSRYASSPSLVCTCA